MTVNDNGEVPEIFADGVFDVGFGNGMVRIDLFSLSAVRRDDNGQPAPAIRQRVVMSLPGFLASLQVMEGMRRRLEEAGLIPAAEATPKASPAAEPAANPAAVTPRSPNFR